MTARRNSQPDMRAVSDSALWAPAGDVCHEAACPSHLCLLLWYLGGHVVWVLILSAQQPLASSFTLTLLPSVQTGENVHATIIPL